MAQRLKRWESPRHEGRNDKGRGGSARQRQVRKQRQQMIRKLKDGGPQRPSQQINQPGEGEEPMFVSLFICSQNVIPDLPIPIV